MRIDDEHLLDWIVKDFPGLDEVAEVRYPTGCVDLTKKEILAKLCQMEFITEATWTHPFLDDLEKKFPGMSAQDLAGELVQRLQVIYDWDESAYYIMLG